MRRLVVGMLVLVVGAGGVACGGKDEPLGPTATLPQGTTTTNPYAIPPVIDEAYVNRVLAGLDQGIGNIVRLVVKTRTISPEAIERLEAFYIGHALQRQVDGFQTDMFDGFRAYRENPGNQVTTVTELIDGQRTCIFAQVAIDFSPVSLQPDPAFSTQWVVLAPSNPDTDPRKYNPTGWILLYQGFDQNLSAPPNPCAAS